MAQRSTDAEFSLGDFQLLEELFRSANGAVFKAKHRSSRQVFVLKQRMCAELGARKDMLNEARLLQRLRHRNVVQCFGFFFDESRTLLYMVRCSIFCVQTLEL
jgi:serine/threonine protein kinase